MNEQQIRQAWQRSQTQSADIAATAGLFADSAAEREQALAVVVDDALAADIARVGLALQAEAGALSSAVTTSRQPARSPFTLRRVGGWALAASVIGAALLVSRLPADRHETVADQAPPTLSANALIVAGSFESTGADIPATAPAAATGQQVFAGGFDS